MAKQKVKKYADGGMAMMAPKFPSNFTPPAPGQTYINPNIKPAGPISTLPPRLQGSVPSMPMTSNPAIASIRTARANLRPGPRFKSGGKVGSASKRADGIATKGKTKGRII